MKDFIWGHDLGLLQTGHYCGYIEVLDRDKTGDRKISLEALAWDGVFSYVLYGAFTTTKQRQVDE